MFTQEHVDIIKKGGVGVIPTDTQYGIIASSHDKEAFDSIIKLKGLNSNRKGFVNLISKQEDLEEFGIEINDFQKRILEKIWPGPYSVIFEVDENHKDILRFSAHAFRLPDNKQILDFVSKTGPIIATSANETSMPSSRSITEAREYFGDKVDFYVDGGMLDSEPSTIIMIKDSQVEVIRKGKGDISVLKDYIVDIIK
jgi:L-threonylcarbamoyladenylate synthase